MRMRNKYRVDKVAQHCNTNKKASYMFSRIPQNDKIPQNSPREKLSTPQYRKLSHCKGLKYNIPKVYDGKSPNPRVTVVGGGGASDMPLFSLPSQKGKKTDRGLYREQKQKWLTDTRRNCHPCGFHLVETSKKRTGTAKKLSLSLPPPHFPLLSLSLSLFPQLSLSFSLYREPGTGHHA